MAALQLGSIVWVEVPDPNGFIKLRPVVIVTPTERIAAGERRLHAVAITSRLSEPLHSDHVLLPWHAQGHVRTRLNRRCAAVCSWIVDIQTDNIGEVGGIVPAPVMIEILRQVTDRIPPAEQAPSESME